MAFRSSAITSSNTGGNLTATPSGVAAHDYLLGWFTRDGNHGAPTYPSGWTQRGANTDTTPDGQDCYSFDKDDATGSDSFTVTDGNTNQSALITSAYSGRNNAAPRSATPVVTSNTASNTSPISATYIGITAVAGDDIAVLIMTDQVAADGRWNASTITNYTQQRDGVNVDWVSGFGLQTRDNVGGGATGNFAVTWTRTTGTGNAGYRGVVHAIAAAAGGGGSVKPQLMMLGVGS